MAENSLIRSIRPMVLSAVFAALIAVGAFIQFNLPFTPVPVTLQTLFVLLAGLFLPPGWALASIFLYLFAGLIGLPVFASGMRGFAAFQGPSAGFLLGFAVAAPIVSLISRIGQGEEKAWAEIIWDLAAVFIGTVIIYAAGYPWIVLNLGWEWRVGLARAVVPYLPGDILKIIASVLLAASGRKIILGNA